MTNPPIQTMSQVIIFVPGGPPYTGKAGVMDSLTGLSLRVLWGKPIVYSHKPIAKAALISVESLRMAVKASSSVHGGTRVPTLWGIATLMISLSTASLAQGIAVPRFGTMPDGHSVALYALRNRAGSEATVISLGATLQSLRLHDREGHPIDVVLGYDSLAEYLNGGSYFGATIGRYANRIAHAEFSLDGKTHHLPANNGEHPAWRYGRLQSRPMASRRTDKRQLDPIEIRQCRWRSGFSGSADSPGNVHIDGRR